MAETSLVFLVALRMSGVTRSLKTSHVISLLQVSIGSRQFFEHGFIGNKNNDEK